MKVINEKESQEKVAGKAEADGMGQGVNRNGKGCRITPLVHGLAPEMARRLGLGGAGRGCKIGPRPLGDLNAAMRDLNLGWEGVMALVEQQILTGFNIAREGEGRLEIRILTSSLSQFIETGGSKPLRLEWGEMWRSIVGNGRAWPVYALEGRDLVQALNCSRGHLRNLASRYFTTLRAGGRGRGRTGLYRADSVEKWLRSRMI